MKTTSSAAAAVVLSALCLPCVALPADLPKEGTYDITACFTRVLGHRIDAGPSFKASTLEQIGMSFSSPPGGLFDREAVRCIGVSTQSAGKSTTNNVCESVDKEGDRRVTRFYSAPDGTIVREHVTGTGKYDGLESTGTYTVLGSYPSIKEGTSVFCNRQQGTYKLK